MKNLSIAIVFLLTTVVGYAQNKSLSDPAPYFTAIIVSDIDTSVAWYSEKFGFEILNRVDLEERGFRQANLKRGGALIELIESKATIYPKDVLAGKPRQARLAGFFKFGFSVPDFDEWVDRLTESGAEFHGGVVKDPNSGKKMLIVKDPDGNRIQLFEL